MPSVLRASDGVIDHCPNGAAISLRLERTTWKFGEFCRTQATESDVPQAIHFRSNVPLFITHHAERSVPFATEISVWMAAAAPPCPSIAGARQAQTLRLFGGPRRLAVTWPFPALTPLPSLRRRVCPVKLRLRLAHKVTSRSMRETHRPGHARPATENHPLH